MLCLAPDARASASTIPTKRARIGEDKITLFRGSLTPRPTRHRPTLFRSCCADGIGLLRDWPMLLTEIDHVAIAVSDLEAAIDYYQRAFGAEVAHREIVESDGVEEALLKVADSYIQLTHADPRRLADRQVRSRSAARACTTSATASTTAPPRSRR